MAILLALYILTLVKCTTKNKLVAITLFQAIINYTTQKMKEFTRNFKWIQDNILKGYYKYKDCKTSNLVLCNYHSLDPVCPVCIRVGLYNPLCVFDIQNYFQDHTVIC